MYNHIREVKIISIIVKRKEREMKMNTPSTKKRLISFEYRIVSIFPVSFFDTLTIFFYNETYKQNLQKYKFKIGMKIDKLFIIHRRNVKMSKRPKSSLSKIHSPISLSFQHPVLTTQGKSLDNVGFIYTHTHTPTHIYIYTHCASYLRKHSHDTGCC